MLRKLLMIVFGISLVLAAGNCNIYPLYINQMMEKFGFSLKEVNLFGSFINMGLWMAFTVGLFYDKFGPKLSCIVGAVLLSGSYAVLHLIMNSDLKTFSLIPFLIIALLMGQGSALCYTTAITANLKNFQSDNSAIVGLLVSNMAISPSIFTTYREALPNVRIANYFLMISVFLAIIILFCGWVFTNIQNIYSDHEKLKEYERYKEKKIIRLFVIVNIFILAVYTFGVVFNNVFSDDNNKFPNVIVYPCLQMLNFLFVVFEKVGLWEKIYFKDFIDKQIKLQTLEEEAKIKNFIKVKNLNTKLEEREEGKEYNLNNGDKDPREIAVKSNEINIAGINSEHTNKDDNNDSKNDEVYYTSESKNKEVSIFMNNTRKRRASFEIQKNQVINNEFVVGNIKDDKSVNKTICSNPFSNSNKIKSLFGNLDFSSEYKIEQKTNIINSPNNNTKLDISSINKFEINSCEAMAKTLT